MDNNQADTIIEYKHEALAFPAGQNPLSLSRTNKDEDEIQSSPLWLITFTDIMALMLTFFVLLYSMAEPDAEKWSGMTATINSNLSQYRSPEWNAGTVDAIMIERVDHRRALDLRYLSSIIRQALDQSGQGKDVLIFAQKDALVISMPQNLLFQGGSDEVQPAGQRMLFEIGGALEKIRNAIEIVGHADPRPLGENEAFTDNWDLSLARATAVAGVMSNVGYTRPITVRGMSSARYNDLPQDMALEEKRDLSRRVDIVILKNDNVRRSFLGMDL